MYKFDENSHARENREADERILQTNPSFLFLIRFPEVAVIKRVSGSRRKIVHATLGFMAYGHIGFLVSRLEANQSVTRFP